MRILQVAPVPCEIGGVDTGGIATHAWSLARHLAMSGHDVAVLADNRPYEGVFPDVIDGVAVYPTRGFTGSRRTAALLRPSVLLAAARVKRQLGPGWRWRWALGAAAAFDQVVRDFRPEIIHVHGIEGRLAVALFAARGRGRLIATTHSTHYFEHAEPGARDRHKGLVARNLDRLDSLVFVSRYLEGRYRELFPTALARIRTRVILNPVDTALYAPVDRAASRVRLGVPQDARVALFVGNLIPRKAPVLFAEALGILRNRGVAVRGLLVGDGSEADAVRAVLERDHSTGLLRLEGRKAQDELAPYYGAADVFVLPSLMESFGLVATEAMLSGCPVVGTPEVLPEVVPDFAGICVATHDASALADAIARALDVPWDRAAIREWALGFDWNMRLSEFESLYAKRLAE
jgi:glycosyltransferase involved in cell wall biosynthesis